MRLSSASVATTGRALTFALGVTAIVWGVLVFPYLAAGLTLTKTVTGIIRGEAFKSDALVREVDRYKFPAEPSRCFPAGLRGIAILRLRLVEDGISAANLELADLQKLDEDVRSALSCAPADPYLWLALFWVESNLHGFRPDHLTFLRMSYRLGPNEAWIGLKRSRFAFAIFDQLPSDLAEEVVREFLGFLRSGLYSEAADIFIGPAWRVRDMILARLSELPQSKRQAFAKVLREREVDVAVPGIEPAQRRTN